MHMYCWILSKLLVLLYSTIFLFLCRIMSYFVEFCRILSNVFIVYIIISPIISHVYCIHYYCIHVYNILFIMYTIYYLKCIQYFFLYLLDKVHVLCNANFISNILIPLKSQVKTYKKIIFLFSIDLCFKVCLCIYILLPTCQALKHSYIFNKLLWLIINKRTLLKY